MVEDVLVDSCFDECGSEVSVSISASLIDALEYCKEESSERLS